MSVHRLLLRERSILDIAGQLLLGALVVVALLTVGDYAISNDEEVQHRYGELIVAYYASGFADQALFRFKDLYLYGGLFDVMAVLLARALPFDAYAIRHVLCVLIGIGGVAATFATARLIAGPRAGLIAAVALAACGTWYGTMFNHTKDVTFAAAMMTATWFLLRLGRDLPAPRLRHVLGFGLMLGAALGLRVLGLLLIGYAGLAVLTGMPHPGREWRAALGFVLRSGIALLPALVLGYLIMLAAWPWAALAPLNPLRALTAFNDFHYTIHTLLAGKTYSMAEVPRWYMPAYFAIKLTLPILVGAVLALIFLLRPPPAPESPAPRWRRETGLVAFIALFPIISHIVTHGPAFSGLRHLMFVIPPLAVLAGIGIDALLAWMSERRLAVAAVSAAVIGTVAWDASQLVRLHPHQYLYFNPLVGGLAGAAGRYDTDYWVNSMPDMVRALEAFLDREGGDGKRRYTVGICAERPEFERRASRRLQWTSDWPRAEFFLSPTHMGCDKALDGTVIATVERLGVPIGVVKDRRGLLASDQ